MIKSIIDVSRKIPEIFWAAAGLAKNIPKFFWIYVGIAIILISIGIMISFIIHGGITVKTTANKMKKEINEVENKLSFDVDEDIDLLPLEEFNN